MTVSTTLVSNVLDVVGAGGAGAGAPLIGISPAITVTDNSPVRATANTKRFILVSFAIEDATVVVSEIAKAEVELAAEILRSCGCEG